MRLLAAKPVILLILLLFMIFIAYSNTLSSPPVLDDILGFLENSKLQLRDFSLTSIKQLATTEFGIERFIPLLTFAVSNKLAFGNLPYYHLTNIFIHLLAVTTLYFFLQGLFTRTTLREHRSFLPTTLVIIGVCGLWGLSPVQTNAVTYLVQRMTSLMALFYLLAMTFYLYGRTASPGANRNLHLLLCAGSAALAFISKENSATLPLALLLLECTIINPGSATRFLAGLKTRQWLCIGMVLLIALPIPLKILGEMVNSYGGRPFNCAERLLTESRVVVWYISLLALPLPSRMNLDHDFLISRSLLSPPTTLLSIILLCLLVATTFKYRHKSPLLTFGVFFFFLNLLIESTVVPLELVFEHRLYLPSVGFFLALAGGFDLLLSRYHDKFGEFPDYRPFWVGLVIILSISSILTTLRNNDWQDPSTLYADSLSKSPGKPRAYANYGMALGRQGFCDKAVPILEKAISLGTRNNEQYLASANNLLNCLKLTAGPSQAAARAEELLKNLPADANLIALPHFLFNLGNSYWDSGNYPSALKAYQEALRAENPGDNGYIMTAVTALINEVYQTKGDGSAIGMADLSDKSTAVTYALAEISLEIRDYKTAEELLAKANTNSVNQEQGHLLKLKNRLTDEQLRNRLVAEATDISRNKFFNSSRKNRMILTISRLITDHYPPLYFLADLLLSHLQTQSPENPFVELSIIRLQSARKSPTFDLETLRKTSAANPYFATLLEKEASQLLALNRREEAMDSVERLLKTYPGSPNWRYWQAMMKKFSKS